MHNFLFQSEHTPIHYTSLITSHSFVMFSNFFLTIFTFLSLCLEIFLSWVGLLFDTSLVLSFLSSSSPLVSSLSSPFFSLSVAWGVNFPCLHSQSSSLREMSASLVLHQPSLFVWGAQLTNTLDHHPLLFQRFCSLSVTYDHFQGSPGKHGRQAGTWQKFERESCLTSRQSGTLTSCQGYRGDWWICMHRAKVGGQRYGRVKGKDKLGEGGALVGFESAGRCFISTSIYYL